MKLSEEARLIMNRCLKVAQSEVGMFRDSSAKDYAVSTSIVASKLFDAITQSGTAGRHNASPGDLEIDTSR